MINTKYQNMRVLNKFNRIMCRYAKNFHNDAFKRTFISAITFKERNLCVSEPNVTNKRDFLHCIIEDKDIEEFSERYLENEPALEDTEHARNVLFKNSNDPKIVELNRCVSVEEVFKFVILNNGNLSDKHLTHTVLVLCDLQNVYGQYNFDSVQFIETLYNKSEFTFLLSSIRDILKDYNCEYLSYTLLYLNKLGLPTENEYVQRILWELRGRLLQHISLDIASRFLRVIFTEYSIRPYYFSKEIVPNIFNKIAHCNSIEDLENLTTCLNKLHTFVTKSVLDDYTHKVEDFLRHKKITREQYKVLLKIILFLNYPEWRNQNILLITKCINLMKDSIYMFNIWELQTLYEVFFRNQEPGGVLNFLQRTSAYFLQQMDEESVQTQTGNKLILFSSLVYFSSPLHRIQFRKDVVKYATQCNSPHDIILLRKVFSYIKVSDEKLCQYYWNKTMLLLRNSQDVFFISKFSENYLHFNIDINNYRHYEFENMINSLIHRHAKSGELFLYPSVFASFLSFFIVYGKSESLLDSLISRLVESWKQIGVVDCLKLSRSLNLLDEVQNKYVTQKQYKTISDLLAKVTKYKFENDADLLEISVLVKGAIYRHDFNNEVVDEMLTKFKQLDYMSSKLMEHLCYFLSSTNSLIPEIINKCTEYVVNNKDNILGFNSEKILYLCFFLNYHPINSEKFFTSVIDIIIRDQERLSGLTFLQCALSLSFFNKLPKSFAKQIFNVEFLDKLDSELANCYSKDRYPQRVRNSLLWLNRSVCLEYPEYNIPWFHQKYVDEKQKKVFQDDDHFFLRFRDYLAQVLGKKECISHNIFTPYGYHIDLVVHLNNQALDNRTDKLAILLTREHAYTRFYKRLKGKHELAKRHLEILGYKVKIVRFNEWINLLYAEERLEFVNKILYPENFQS